MMLTADSMMFYNIRYSKCDSIIIPTIHVIVSSLFLPPPPPTSEGATLGAKIGEKQEKNYLLQYNKETII